MLPYPNDAEGYIPKVQSRPLWRLLCSSSASECRTLNVDPTTFSFLYRIYTYALCAISRLRLLQATIIGKYYLLHYHRHFPTRMNLVGVVVLHLLLIPGTAFLVGGTTIWEQDLHPNATQLNHSLLAVG